MATFEKVNKPGNCKLGCVGISYLNVLPCSERPSGAGWLCTGGRGHGQCEVQPGHLLRPSGGRGHGEPRHS